MASKYILVSLLDVGIGFYFFGLCGLLNIAWNTQGWKTLWLFPMIALWFGSFLINQEVDFRVEAYLRTDADMVYFLWFVPMCLGMIGGAYYFKIRKDNLKKKLGIGPDKSSGA